MPRRARTPGFSAQGWGWGIGVEGAWEPGCPGWGWGLEAAGWAPGRLGSLHPPWSLQVALTGFLRARFASLVQGRQIGLGGGAHTYGHAPSSSHTHSL